MAEEQRERPEPTEYLPEDRDHILLWAGRGDHANPGASDLFLFAQVPDDGGVLRDLTGVDNSDEEGWDRASLEGAEPVSLETALVELPFDTVVGFDLAEDSSAPYYLAGDDVAPARVRALGGQELDVVDGVVLAEESGWPEEETPFVSELDMAGETVYTTTRLSHPLSAEDWTEAQAAPILRETVSGQPLLGLDQDRMLELASRPDEVALDEGTGTAVPTVEHIRVASNPSEGRPTAGSTPVSGLLVVNADGEVDLARYTGEKARYLGEGDSLPGSGNRQYAVAIEGLSSGPAVGVVDDLAADGGSVRTTPELPVIGRSEGEAGEPPGRITILSPAPERTAVIWLNRDDEPGSVDLVRQPQDDAE